MNLSFPSLPHLISSHVWQVITPLSICLRIPWHSLTSVVPLFSGRSIPTPLVDTGFLLIEYLAEVVRGRGG